MNNDLSGYRLSLLITTQVWMLSLLISVAVGASASTAIGPIQADGFLISGRKTLEINPSVAANGETGNFLVVWTDDERQEVLSSIVTPSKKPTSLAHRSVVWTAPRGRSVDTPTAAYGPGTGVYLVLWNEGEKWPAEPGALSRADDFIQLRVVDEDGKPWRRQNEPLRLTDVRCGAASPSIAFEADSRRWLVLWQEHDGPDEGPQGQWECDVDGPWIVFGHFVAKTSGGVRVMTDVEIDIADDERTGLPRIVPSPTGNSFEVVYTTFWSDEAITFWPPSIRMVRVASPSGEVEGPTLNVASRTWGALLPAVTPLTGTDLTLVTWARDPGGSQSTITEGRLMGRRPSKKPTYRLSWAGKPFPQMSPVFTIAKHQLQAQGMGLVAAATYRDEKVLVVWEEPGDETSRLRARFLPYGTGRRQKTRPFDIGTGALSPDGHGVACLPQGWCLVAFERDGDIYGRLIPARSRR